MLQKLKDLWNNWNVQVKVVGGALVVATVWGTCVYEPSAPAADEESSEQSAEPASTTEATETEVTGTTTEATEVEVTGTTTEATEAETTE